VTSGSVFSAARLSILALFVTAAGAHAEGRVVEIARGHSWVSPYWGYSSPKIVSDGTAWYTAGLWGADPDSSYGVLYKCDGAAWHEGAHLSNIYQPVTLALDAQGRLLAAYTEQLQPVRIYRSQAPGNIHDLERLPSPPDMKNAYYIGIAIREDVLYLAYLVTPEYSMFLATLNLASLEWTPSRLVCPGQIERKPKTAWTYPILYPAEDGLHLVASNAPDGGEGNTYNQVWYLFYPHGAHEPSIRELVAETPMGHLSYALDFAIDADGTRHTLFLWNQRKYGDPLPPDSPPAGLYHGWRNDASQSWLRSRLLPDGYGGFFVSETGLTAVSATNKTLLWQGPRGGWKDGGPFCQESEMPGAPGFFDVISPASGSRAREGMAIVTDSVLATEKDHPAQRVLWAILPE